MSCPTYKCGLPLKEGSRFCYACDRKIAKAKKSVEPPNEKSEKQTVADKAYAIVAKAFKAANPVCQAQLQGCTKATSDVHHKLGRSGRMLLDEEHFLAVCRHCHSQIELKSDFAKALGLSGNRIAINHSQTQINSDQ